ncbi:MAG TPA: formate dehydrogenase accessory sulfurtransferase FdhD [Ktedonobacterales bacterium]|nr:formate dehydrogenase accessory sulfurtransferase FdhD [Ktedonobacterales bacterium]
MANISHLAQIGARSQADPLRQVRVSLVRWHGATADDAEDELVAEEPLEVRVAPDGDTSATTLAVIMRTPGHDEELAAGFLFSEGLLTSHAELTALRSGSDADGLPSPNVIEVVPVSGLDIAQRAQEAGYSRQFAVNASCGVCGKNSVMAACAVLPPLPADDFAITPDTLYALPDRLRAEQRVFRATGGLHAAGLFDSQGKLLALREDIGRHNAVDKLVGRALLDDALPLRERILLVSGRLSFEIVLKALAAGIPLVAAVSAPSQLAVDLAESGGVTLAAFLRGASVNVYTHPWRIHAG